MSDVEKMLDDAAACSQCHDLLQDTYGVDGHVRECVRLNVVEPLQKELEAKDKRIAELETTIERVKNLELLNGALGSRWVNVVLLHEALKGDDSQ